MEFRLYLGASLCTYFFSSYLVFDGIFLLGGVLCLIGTLFVSCFKLLIDLYVFIYVLFEIKKLFCLLVLFPHMRLCILFSVSGNIKVDSIELLSTLATDG